MVYVSYDHLVLFLPIPSYWLDCHGMSDVHQIVLVFYNDPILYSDCSVHSDHSIHQFSSFQYISDICS